MSNRILTPEQIALERRVKSHPNAAYLLDSHEALRAERDEARAELERDRVLRDMGDYVAMETHLAISHALDEARARIAELEARYRVHGAYLPPEGVDVHDLTREQLVGLSVVSANVAERQRVRIAELEAFFVALDAERQWDESPGDVIAAYKDGSIILDDSIATYHPLRACAFLVDERDRLHAEIAELEAEIHRLGGGS